MKIRDILLKAIGIREVFIDNGIGAKYLLKSELDDEDKELEVRTFYIIKHCIYFDVYKR
jgi:hypothetical protein